MVKRDIIAALNNFHSLRCADLNLLNSPSVVLIPKKDRVETVQDFRPISLIHAIAKIISKIMANRLAPRMDELIAPCQKLSSRDEAFMITSFTCAT